MKLYNKIFSLILVVCLLISAIPFSVTAAYDVVPATGNGIVRYSSNQAILYVNGATWADAHYKINNGTDINIRMDVDSNGQNTLVINGLNDGDVISYWFTIYTTYATDVTGFADYTHSSEGSSTDDTETETKKDAYVFKVDSKNAYSVVNGSFTIDVPCQYYNGVIYVPFRVIASAAGAKSINYNSSDTTITIVNNANITFKLKMESTAIQITNENGTTQSATLNSAPIYIEGKACLPVRDTTIITSANIKYVSKSATLAYVVVCADEMSDSEIEGYIAEAVKAESGLDTGKNEDEDKEDVEPISRYNNSNTADTTIPALRTDIVQKDNMFVQLNNNTNGKYSDSEIYWCIIGKDPNTGAFCYVNSSGQLVPCTTALNTISKGDRMCADICYTLEECDYVYMPDITSGRMYFSYGDQVYITINIDGNGNIGYAGPDLNNTSDPNQDVLFEFIEFTITDGVYWGNTTRVDFFSFPIVTRLVGTNGFVNAPGDADVYDMTVGDMGTRAEIFAAYKNEVPDSFKTLVTDERILAPCKGTFNEGNAYSNYFENYINEFWNKYSNNPFTFTCDAGQFTCYTSGDYLYFTSSSGQTGTVKKPNTQEVLEGKGALASGTSIELVVEAQLCAAFNRGVATSPENWGNAEAFYKNGTANYYAGFWHEHSVSGYAYGFCYDDVFDYSTLLHYSNPSALVVDLRW